MKISKAFEIAKKYVNNVHEDTLTGPQMFICNALELAADKGLIPWEASADCQCIVLGRLQGAFTLEAWLTSKGYLPRKFLHDDALRQRIQDYRLAWLDELIKEFKAKGE